MVCLYLFLIHCPCEFWHVDRLEVPSQNGYTERLGRILWIGQYNVTDDCLNNRF